MDRVVSTLRTALDYEEDERPLRTPLRRLARMSEGVFPGYTAILCGKDPNAVVRSHRSILGGSSEDVRRSGLRRAYTRLRDGGDHFLRRRDSTPLSPRAKGATAVVPHTEHCSFSDLRRSALLLSSAGDGHEKHQVARRMAEKKIRDQSADGRFNRVIGECPAGQSNPPSHKSGTSRSL